MTRTSTPSSLILGFDELLDRLEGVERHGRYAMALCPAHPDLNPSLSVSQGEIQDVVFHCHAGCSYEAIVEALELPAGERRDGQLETVYPYYSAHGDLLYEVVRRHPKTFQMRRPDGAGGYIYELDGVPRVPFRLPELIGTGGGELIFVLEGEKDVERLRSEGLVATCNPGGAGKWRDEFAEYFAGASVVVIPDNDAPGRDHAQQVIRNVSTVARAVAVVDLPGLGGKGDVSDWLATSGTAQDLLKLAQQALRGHSPRRLYTIEELSDLPPVEYLVDGFVQMRGLNMLYGPSGTGKTFVALDLSLSVASGELWHRHSTRRGTVVYVAAEGGDGLSARVNAWIDDRSPAHSADIRYRVAPFNLLRSEEVADFIADVSDLEPAMVVVDPLARFIEGADENSSRDMGIVMSNLNRILRETGSAVLLTHHTGKDATRGERGHSLIRAAHDTAIEVRGEPGNGISLTVKKSRDRPSGQGQFLRLEPLATSAVLREFERQTGLSQNAQRALDVLAKLEGGATSSAWQACSGLGNSSFQKARKELEAAGLLEGGGAKGAAYRLAATEADSDDLSRY